MLEFLEKYYRIARRVITKNNGVWDKAIGDGIMCWFGSIDYNQKKASDVTKITRNACCTEDCGALDAITAAIELRNCFKSLKEELKSKWMSRINELSTLHDNMTPDRGRKKASREWMRQDSVEEKNYSCSGKIKAIVPDFDLKCGINTGAARVCLFF